MNFVEWLLRNNYHVEVTSALRTKESNAACGGSPNSQHLTGDAIDFKIAGKTPAEIAMLVRAHGFRYDQLIQYRTFVHISFSRRRDPRQMFLDFTDRK